MNSDLGRLRQWASDMAVSDPDRDARPLWGQIASEVDAHLEQEETPAQSGADLFGGAS